MICACVWRSQGVEEARGRGMHGRAVPAEAGRGGPLEISGTGVRETGSCPAGMLRTKLPIVFGG